MATQNFTGTNGDALPTVDAKWNSVTSVGGPLVRTGGVCKPDAVGHSAFYFYGDGQPNDQSSQADISVVDAGDIVYLAVEMRAGGNLGYTAKFSNGTNIEIRKDGVYQTDYTSTVNHGASAATAKIRLTSAGDLIVSINGSDLSSPLNVVAGGRITGGFPGIGMDASGASNATSLDNWTDSIAAGTSISARAAYNFSRRNR